MYSIRIHLLAALLITGLVPVGIIYHVTGNKTAEALTKGEYAKIREMAGQVAGQLDSLMGGAADDLQSLSSNPFLTGADVSDEEKLREMSRLVGVYDMFSDISLYDRDGYILLSTTENEPENHERSAWFKRALEGETVISDPHKLLYDKTGMLYLSVYIPVFDKAKAVASMVKARIPFEKVWSLFDRVTLGENGFMTLIDENGNYLTSRNRSLILTKIDEDTEVHWWRENPEGIYDFDGDATKRQIFVSMVLPPEVTRVGRQWTLIAFEPQGEVNLVVENQRVYQLGVAFATLILVVALGYLLGTVFSRPFVQASAVAGAVARGTTAARIADAGPKEVRELAASFNVMAEEVLQHRDHLNALVESRTIKLEESEGNLRALSAQLRASYDAAAEGILVVGKDGGVIAANRKMGDFFGLDAEGLEGGGGEIGRLLDGCFAPEDGFGAFWSRMVSDPEKVEEQEWKVAAPKRLILSLYTAPVKSREGEILARLWMFRDLTEQRHLQANLEQSQKMDAIGRLAGGVAHDFNNLLTGIIGNLSLIELDLAEGHVGQTTDGYLCSAKKAGQRAADLVRQLLGFSRRSSLRMRRCDVGEIITEVQQLLQASISPEITIATDVEGSLWSIEADSTQIQQVLMNMCVNARDALPEGRGRIVMSAANARVNETKVALRGAQGTEFVRFSIKDNGSGIPPEVLEKMWEPFFTTKEQGKGTGLGLATSYGIVQQHGGWIECASVMGQGTTFHVYVPRKIFEEEAAELVVEGPSERGTETILLVDDEVLVRTVAQGFLKRNGYQTLTASDGLEAVEIISERGREIDLVLLDLTMPRLSGKDTFRKIREMYPDMPVVICSGYLLDIGDFESEVGSRPSGVVQKPYRTEDLYSTCRKAIDDRVKGMAGAV